MSDRCCLRKTIHRPDRPTKKSMSFSTLGKVRASASHGARSTLSGPIVAGKVIKPQTPERFFYDSECEPFYK